MRWLQYLGVTLVVIGVLGIFLLLNNEARCTGGCSISEELVHETVRVRTMVLMVGMVLLGAVTGIGGTIALYTMESNQNLRRLLVVRQKRNGSKRTPNIRTS